MESVPPVPYPSRQYVPFDMLDALGVLYNANYLVLFERARMDFFRTQSWPLLPEGVEWPYYVVRNEVTYHAPIGSPQETIVTVGIARLGNTSLTFTHALIAADGTLAADGLATIVRVNPETQRPTPWQESFRQIVAPYLPASP